MVFKGLLRADMLISDLWLRVQVCSLGSAFQALLREGLLTPLGQSSPEMVILQVEFGWVWSMEGGFSVIVQVLVFLTWMKSIPSLLTHVFLALFLLIRFYQLVGEDFIQIWDYQGGHLCSGKIPSTNEYWASVCLAGSRWLEMERELSDLALGQFSSLWSAYSPSSWEQGKNPAEIIFLGQAAPGWGGLEPVLQS